MVIPRTAGVTLENQRNIMITFCVFLLHLFFLLTILYNHKIEVFVFILKDHNFYIEILNSAVKKFFKVSEIIKVELKGTLPDRTNTASEWHIFFPHLV